MVSILYTISALSAVMMSSLFLAPTNGMTIDEMIFQASENVDQFDLIADLNGDYIRQEWDMMLTIDQYRALNGLDGLNGTAVNDNPSSSRKKRKAIKSSTYRWTNNIIPYAFKPGVFSARDKKEIQMAIDEWSKYTCIDFQPTTNRQRNHVSFDNGQGCYSYVGMTGRPQTIGLARGCRHKGVIVHEIGHAVGFHHEQNRPDRDDYVTINFRNIPESVRYNFKKYPWSSVTTLNVPYDYTSIMHYGGKAFSNNNGYTIVTKDPRHQNIIGNRKGLSFNDIKLANLMYKCGGNCRSNIKCPSFGFRGKDCTCWCPGSPVKKCDGSTVVTDHPGRTTARPPKTTTPKIMCKDQNQHCAAWVKSPRNYCVTNQYVKNYCKESCKTCDGGKKTVDECNDKRTSCSRWKARGYCIKSHTLFMKNYCPLSCGYCQVGTSKDLVKSAGNSISPSWLFLMVGNVVLITGKMTQ